MLARLLPPLRTGVFIIAGTIRYSFGKFIIADTIYGIVGVGLVFFGGTALVALLHQVGSWLFIVVIVVVAAIGLFYYYRYLRKLEMKTAARVTEALLPTPPQDAHAKAESPR